MPANHGEDEIEIIDNHQPPAKKKKIHPLRKFLGNNFGGPSSSATDENTDNIQAEIARYKAELQVLLEVNGLWYVGSTVRAVALIII